jgi:hypothetical protein
MTRQNNSSIDSAISIGGQRDAKISLPTSPCNDGAWPASESGIAGSASGLEHSHYSSIAKINWDPPFADRRRQMRGAMPVHLRRDSHEVTMMRGSSGGYTSPCLIESLVIDKICSSDIRDGFSCGYS